MYFFYFFIARLELTKVSVNVWKSVVHLVQRCNGRDKSSYVATVVVFLVEIQLYGGNRGVVPDVCREKVGPYSRAFGKLLLVLSPPSLHHQLLNR